MSLQDNPLLMQREETMAALVALDGMSWLDQDPCNNEYLAKAKDQARAVLIAPAQGSDELSAECSASLSALVALDGMSWLDADACDSDELHEAKKLARDVLAKYSN
jgi:hypothetical protein